MSEAPVLAAGMRPEHCQDGPKAEPPDNSERMATAHFETTPARRTLTDLEVAARLGVSRFTVRSWRLKGVGPRFLKMGRAVRYRPEDVEAYVQQALIAPLNEGATARTQQT